MELETIKTKKLYILNHKTTRVKKRLKIKNPTT